MVYLIITADDFGSSHGINEAVIEGGKAGIITSTNVMTNMGFASEAIDIKKHVPQMSVGLHWTVTEGYPICAVNEVNSLVDKEGKFWERDVFYRRFMLGKIKHNELRKELIAQYQKFVEICKYEPDYWNSHQNPHVEFGTFGFFVRVAEECGIKRMRWHKKQIVPSTQDHKWNVPQSILETVKVFVFSIWNAWIKYKGFYKPDGLVTFLTDEDKFQMPLILNRLKCKDNAVVEFTIHPATCIDGDYFGSLRETRIQEYQMVVNSNFAENLPSNVKLVNYMECR